MYIDLHEWLHTYGVCLFVLSLLSSHAYLFTFFGIRQVGWLGATAHGVCLASIRPGRV